MRILFCWPSVEFSTYDVAVGIRAGLLDLGHEVIDYRLYRRLGFMERALSAMAPAGKVPAAEMVCLHAAEALPYKAITEGTPWALVISGMSLHPNGLWALRRIGVKVAILFTESPYERQEFQLTEFADLAFITERSQLAQFQAALSGHTGGKAMYLPHAYNPDVHCPEGETAEGHDVVFVGTGFAERQWLLENIDWTGIDLCLGGLWPGLEEPNFLVRYCQYPCLANEDVAKLYRSTKIVINPHRLAPEAESLNPRAYEAAACGAFQIISYRAEAEEIFDGSAPTYDPRVPWQLEALIRQYLADEEARRKMAAQAHECVRACTVTERARTIVETMEEMNNGDSTR